MFGHGQNCICYDFRSCEVCKQLTRKWNSINDCRRFRCQLWSYWSLVAFLEAHQNVSLDKVTWTQTFTFSLPSVHVFESQNDFCSVKLHVRLIENAVLGEMIVQVAAVHQIENEAEFAGRVESVSHANDEGAIFSSRYEAQHCSLVESQRFALLHLDTLFIETLHRIHFSRVDLSATVHLSEAPASDYTKNTKVIHRELL